MQFVGEAVREYQLAGGCNRQPIVALGITTWGTVDNKEALISADKVVWKYLDCSIVKKLSYRPDGLIFVFVPFWLYTL